jgi:hypothetical protein
MNTLAGAASSGNFPLRTKVIGLHPLPTQNQRLTIPKMANQDLHDIPEGK